MKRVLALGAIGFVLAGCGGGSSSPAASAPSVSPASLVTPVTGCAPASLPAGFAADRAHTGKLTAHTYSASADVQAALEYDQLQSGTRRTYVHHAGGAHAPIDAVASCVSLRFGSAPLAARFFASYRTLRRQAKSIVHEITPRPAVHGLTGTTGYFEKQQSFRGYRINSTNVIEVAGLGGQTLYIASVAGASPSRPLATNLLKTMVSHA